MLPEGWSEIALEDLANVERGKFSARPRNDPKFYNGTTPFVQTGDVSSSDTYLREYTQTLNDEGVKVSKIFPKGTILVTIAANIGDSAIAEFDVACPDSVVGIQCYQEKSNNIWLKFKIDTIKKNLDNEAGKNAQKNINLQLLKPLKILTPPLPEQEKIAAVLSTWDKAISTTDALLANSRQQKKALMQQLLTGKRRLPGFTGEWKKCLLGNLLREIKRQISWDDNAFYKLLSVKRRSEGVVLREIMQGKNILTKKMNEVYAGDFLISKMQVVHGAMAMVSENFNKFHVSDSYITLIPRRANILHMPFFDHFSRQLKMYHMALISSYGVHIEKMTFNIASFLKKSIFIPVDISEQRAIAAVLDAADREIVLLEQKAACLREEKKALMQQLLTGKRRVRL